VFFMESRGTVLEGLTIEAPAATDVTGLIIDAGTASHVAVTGPAAGTSSTGLTMNGGLFTEGSIAMPSATGSATTGVTAHGGEVVGSSISGEYAAQEEVVLRRCTLIPGAYGVISYNDKLTVEDTLIDLSDKHVIGIDLIANAGTATGTFRHLTIINGGVSSRGVIVEAPAAKQTATATLSDSIIAGVEVPLIVSAEKEANSSLRASYSSYAAAANKVLGLGKAVLFNESPASEVPGFVNPVVGAPGAGDWRLAPGSALIDAGTPGALGVAESSTDLTGSPRIVHARRDVGAYEYQFRAPVVSAQASLAGAKAGAPISFTGTASAPEPGDSIASYSWAFDDGVTTAGQAVPHAFAKPGTHTATVTATDVLGVSATASVAVTISAPGGPGCLCKKLSAISKLKLTPNSFRAARRGASLSKPPLGTSITYTLAATGNVTFTISHAVAGVKHGKSCLAPKRGRHGKRCRRYVSMTGSFAHMSKAGANTVHFTGRLHGKRLKPGTYLLLARYEGPAGKVTRSTGFTIVR
jgi:PKD repeat protein